MLDTATHAVSIPYERFSLDVSKQPMIDVSTPETSPLSLRRQESQQVCCVPAVPEVDAIRICWSSLTGSRVWNCAASFSLTMGSMAGWAMSRSHGVAGGWYSFFTRAPLRVFEFSFNDG